MSPISFEYYSLWVLKLLSFNSIISKIYFFERSLFIGSLDSWFDCDFLGIDSCSNPPIPLEEDIDRGFDIWYMIGILVLIDRLFIVFKWLNFDIYP